MRYPQIKYTLKSKNAKFAVSLNRPMDGNVKYEDYSGGDFDPVGGGERTGMPWIMGRLWLKNKFSTVSVSSHYGEERIEDNSQVSHDKRTYSFNADIVASGGPLTFTLKGFYGENLNSFFGGIFQGYLLSNNYVSNVRSKGGWGQLIWKINNSFSYTLGGGMDDPYDSDLTSGMRSLNQWAYANISYTINPAVTFMLEDEFLKTSYVENQSGDNNRIMFVTYFKF
jgi:hypothetical protein